MTEIFAADQIGFPILSLLIVVPLLAAVMLQWVQGAADQRRLALAAGGVELILAALLLVNFVPGSADMQFAERALWLPGIGAGLHFGVDGISVLFIPLTALVILLAMISVRPEGNGRFFWTNVLLFQATTIGIFVSLDLVMFFVFWELILIPSFFLIRMWGTGPRRQAAAMKYVLYMLIGSAPMLIAIVALGANYGEAVAAGTAPAGGNFDLMSLQQVAVPAELQTMIFILLLVAFAVKAPLPPFHTWLPNVVTEGPAGMAIFLVGLKLGTYGMLRFLLPLAPEAALDFQPILVWVGVAAALYGGLIALAQTNLRRLLAYASVSHVGMVFAGLFTLNAAGLQGGLLAMLNMGITSTLLMFLAGGLYQRTGSSELSALGGIARQAPRLAFFFFAIGLATIGMPGTSGFVGEFSILMGVFDYQWQTGAVAVTGVILSAGYLLWYYERAFFGPITSAAVRQMRDLNRRELVGVSAALALVIAIGVAPNTVISVTGGATNALAERLELVKASAVAAQVVDPSDPLRLALK